MSNLESSVWLYYVFAFICTLLVCCISMTYHRRIVNGNGRSINKEIKAFLIIMLWFIVVIFCAFRKISIGYGGMDAIQYKYMFENATGNFSDYLNRYTDFEFGYLFINWVIHKFTTSYHIYLIFLYTVLVLCLVKYAKIFVLNKYFYIGTYCLMLILLESFNTQRNTLAIFLSLYVLESILEKRYLKGILQTILICFLHISAIVYLVPIAGCWLIKYIKGKKMYLIAFYDIVASIGVVILSGVVTSVLTGTRYVAYVGDGSIAWGNLYSIVLLLFIMFIRSNEISSNQKVLDLVFVNLMFIPVIIIQLKFSIAYRMILFVIPLAYIVFSEIKKQISSKRNFINIILLSGINIYFIYRIVNFAREIVIDIGIQYTWMFSQ